MQSIPQRTIKLFGLLLLGVVLASAVVRADVPGFVKESLYSPNAAAVAEIVSSPSADIVILAGGLEQGLRLGMVCRVVRGFKEIGEIIIIESGSDRSAALILEFSENFFIQAGNIARIKTLQNS